MSYVQRASPNPITGPNLSDVSDAIRRNPHLPPRRRQEMLSALNTTAAVLERALEDILANPEPLRRRLEEASPKKRRITPGR